MGRSLLCCLEGLFPFFFTQVIGCTLHTLMSLNILEIAPRQLQEQFLPFFYASIVCLPMTFIYLTAPFSVDLWVVSHLLLYE